MFRRTCNQRIRSNSLIASPRKRRIEEKKHLEDSRRKLRFEKREPTRLESIQEHRKVADLFEKQRGVVTRLFGNASNIDSLFQKELNIEPKDEKVTNYNDLVEKFHSLTYNDPIGNSILLLVNSLITSALTELNLRKLFQAEELPRFLFRNLIKNTKDDLKKLEILKILSQLYNVEVSGKPESMDGFLKKLNRESVGEFLDDLKSDFNSIEQYRTSFEYFKSSQHLNYDNSDCIKFVESADLLQFESVEINNDELVSKFKQSFSEYETYLSGIQLIEKESFEEEFGEIYQSFENLSKLKHLDLVLSISRALLTNTKYTPDLTIFKYLMDSFNKVGLSNCQTLVYQSLPDYKYKPFVLSNKQIPMENFHSLISQNTGILDSLLKYQVVQKDVETFKNLLSFLGLNEVNRHEKLLSKSFLSGILSKSRFIRTSRALTEFEPLTGIIEVDSIYNAIEGCIELEQFEYIDSLFNKLLIHGLDNNKVLLRLDKDFKENLLLTKYSNTEGLSNEIFTKRLIKLLIRALIESDDMGRLMWLLPHLDRYLELNISMEHIERIKLDRLDEGLAELERESKIDIELIELIYSSLVKFGLEGKIVSYDMFLDFLRIVQHKDIGEGTNRRT